VNYKTSKTFMGCAEEDSIGLTVEITTCLRSELSESSGIPVERIMVCFTHNHSAPDGLFEREYVDFLLSRLWERWPTR